MFRLAISLLYRSGQRSHYESFYEDCVEAHKMEGEVLAPLDPTSDWSYQDVLLLELFRRDTTRYPFPSKVAIDMDEVVEIRTEIVAVDSNPFNDSDTYGED